MREIFRCVSVAALCVLGAVFVLGSTVVGQEPEQEQANQLEDWERAELQTLVQTVGAALRGELTQDGNPFTLQPDFLKGADGFTYVPFTVTLDPAQVSQSSIAIYLFVTAHQDLDTAAPPAPADPDTAEDVRCRRCRRPCSRPRTSSTCQPSAPAAVRFIVSRAFAAPGGDYDVYIAIA